MNDSQSLKTYYDERVYIKGSDMPTFEELTDDQKTELSLSYEFSIWILDQDMEVLADEFAEDFANKMSGWLDDDWMFWVFVFLVVIGFILLGMTAVFN